MTFQIDTTGAVAKPGEPVPAPNDVRMQCLECGRDNRGYKGDPCSDDCPSRAWEWSDLSPFVQGYVEALFASEADALDAMEPDAGLGRREGLWLGFSDLAPETLARIIADCEAITQDGREFSAACSLSYEGATFWANRAAGEYADLRPLTVQLGDDGKVRLA